MISAVFIRRPILAGVIAIITVLFGLIAMLTLPIARYPEVAPPAVKVTAIYPGANAETVAETVAQPIEEEINGVEGMAYMSSTSSSDGALSITVTFEVGTDVDNAAILVQNRVSRAEPSLPPEVTRQGISVRKQSSEITLLLTLSSPSGSEDDLFLANYAAINLKNELARLPGVGDVAIFGAGDYAMRIWLDPDKLRARGLTVSDVSAAISEQNVQVAAGQIGAPPTDAGQPRQLVVQTKGRLGSAEEFEEIIVRPGDAGEVVRLKDIARVQLGAQSYTQVATVNSNPTAAIAIYQLPGSNAIAVADAVRSRMEELSAVFPGDIEHAVVYDSTDVIRASVKEVINTLFITLILVVATVYLFLQSLRATIVPTVTIPVSLIGTFAIMALLGFTINQLTLFGLVLVIGIVVDDAIVVVENVTRLINEKGMNPREAAIQSMREVTGPVVATTLVLLAVFVPTIFLPGISGQLFRQFAITISVATVFSSINALTLSPALCAILLRKSENKPFVIFRAFNGILTGLTRVYGGLVGGLLRVATLAALLFVGLAGLGVAGLATLPGGFVPQEDEGWAITSVQLQDGTALPRTNEAVERMSAAVQEIPGVADVIAISGYSVLDGAAVSSNGTLFCIFDSWDERQTPELHQSSIIQQINTVLRQEQDAMAMAFPTPSLPGLGNSSGLTLQLQDRDGRGLRSLQTTLGQFLQTANSQSAFAGVFSTFRASSPRLFVDIDREAVKALDVPLSDVFGTLQAALGSSYVNDFTRFARTFQVRTQADAPFRDDASDILSLEVRSRTGEMIPLGAFAAIEERVGPVIVTRHNTYTSARVIANTAPGTTDGQGMALTSAIGEAALAPGWDFEWTELAYQAQKASPAQAAVVFGLSIVIVFLVLAAQYESWTTPIAVVMAVPAALLGAVAALMLRGIDNNLYTQIGIVLLIGLSTKTAILIVEFAKQLREEGKSIREATIEASKLRLRAVLMTALSFVLGVLPLLIASGAGAESRQAIGTTVFGGMVVATILGTIAVPVLFALIRRVSEMLRHSPKQSTSSV